MMSRYVLVIINAVLLLAGGFIFTSGLWGLNVGSQVSHLVSLSTPTWITILGFVIVLVALWGIYAVITEDQLLLQIVWLFINC